MKLPLPISGLRLAARASAAAAISLGLANWLGLAHPIYAMLGAVIVTDLSSAESQQLGLRRLVATAVGATCGALLSPLLSPGPVSVALGIFVTMLVCSALRAGPAARVAGYICGIVVLSQGTDNWAYAWSRFVETALGVVVAWLISLVPTIGRTDEASPGSDAARPS